MENVTYDTAVDVFTIYGVKYSGELFRQFAQAMPIGAPFRIVKRENGEVILERLYDATCSMCGTSVDLEDFSKAISKVGDIEVAENLGEKLMGAFPDFPEGEQSADQTGEHSEVST